MRDLFAALVRIIRGAFFAPLTFVQWIGSLSKPPQRGSGNPHVLRYLFLSVVVIGALLLVILGAGYFILACFVRLFGLDIPVDAEHSLYTLGVAWTLRWVLSAAATRVTTPERKL